MTAPALPVLLPPPGPALLLHQAAAKLRGWAAAARAEMARNDYWDMGWAAGVENAISNPTGRLAAMFSPDVADETADWLDATAAEAVKHACGLGNLEEEITDGYPTTIARHILAAS